MRQIKLNLQGDKAVPINDPVYIAKDETVEFVITNGNGELFFSTGKENVRIIEGRFKMKCNDLKALDTLKIIERSDALYPRQYDVVLKMHDITVLGRTVDERYPDVIKDIYSQLETLGKAVLDLYDIQKEKEEEGVIE